MLAASSPAILASGDVSSPTTTLEGGHAPSPPRTTKTGQGARITTPSETLPTTSRFTAFSPRLPIATKPTPNSSASSAISSAGRPSLKCFLRSEEHTSELQSRQYLVCRLLLEKKNNPSQRA